MHTLSEPRVSGATTEQSQTHEDDLTLEDALKDALEVPGQQRESAGLEKGAG